MKKNIFILLIAILSLLLTSNIFAKETSLTAKTGFKIDWWDSPNDDTGFQYHIPFKIEALYNNFTLGVLSGYCYSSHKEHGLTRRSSSNMLDTKLNMSYLLPQLLPVDVLVGLDFNLPTGKTNLDDKELAAIMDPDLVSITNFGEGFNINPTIAFAKEWQKWLIGIGFGYVWRGEYDYSKNMHDYDPGDIFSFTTQLHYIPSDLWHIKFFTNFTTYKKDELQGKSYYDEGDYLQIGIGAKYLGSSFAAETIIQKIMRGKSKIAFPTQGFQKERDNSHGDEWICSIIGQYFLNNKTTLKAALNFLLVEENDYPKDSLYYWGERKKLSLQTGIAHNFNPKLKAEFDLTGFFMHDDATWYHPTHSQSYRGFSLTLKLISSF